MCTLSRAKSQFHRIAAVVKSEQFFGSNSNYWCRVIATYSFIICSVALCSVLSQRRVSGPKSLVEWIRRLKWTIDLNSSSRSKIVLIASCVRASIKTSTILRINSGKYIKTNHGYNGVGVREYAVGRRCHRRFCHTLPRVGDKGKYQTILTI